VCQRKHADTTAFQCGGQATCLQFQIVLASVEQPRLWRHVGNVLAPWSDCLFGLHGTSHITGAFDICSWNHTRFWTEVSWLDDTFAVWQDAMATSQSRDSPTSCLMAKIRPVTTAHCCVLLICEELIFIYKEKKMLERCRGTFRQFPALSITRSRSGILRAL